MILGFRFGASGLRLSSNAQWRPVTMAPSPYHDGFPPITIEEPASLVWRSPMPFLALLVRSVAFFAVMLS